MTTELPYCEGITFDVLRHCLIQAGVLPSVVDRFVPKVRVGDITECWPFEAAQGGSQGHGVFWDGQIATSAHRLVYVWLVGPVLPDDDVDHLCRNPPCVNPFHLEAVTHAVNLQRARFRAAEADRCKYGHAFDVENTAIYIQPRNGRPYRQCRTCSRERARTRYRGLTGGVGAT